MSDKFLSTGGAGNVNLSDGSTPIFAQTLGALNLDASTALKTNSQFQIISSDLSISDTTGLQTALNSKIANPMTSTLDYNDNDAENIVSLEFKEQASVSNPPAGSHKVFVNTSGGLVVQDDLGAQSTYTTTHTALSALDGGTARDGGHTYLCALDGRSGGQKINGSPVLGENLILQSNSSNGATGQIDVLSTVDMNTFKIENLATPTGLNDAASKSYVDGFLPLAGGTMAGDIITATKLRNSADTVILNLASNQLVLDSPSAVAIRNSGGDVLSFVAGSMTASGNLAMNTNNITGIGLMSGNSGNVDLSGSSSKLNSTSNCTINSGITGNINLQQNGINKFRYLNSSGRLEFLAPTNMNENSINEVKYIYGSNASNIIQMDDTTDIQITGDTNVFINAPSSGNISNRINSVEYLGINGITSSIEARVDLDMNNNDITSAKSLSIPGVDNSDDTSWVIDASTGSNISVVDNVITGSSATGIRWTYSDDEYVKGSAGDSRVSIQVQAGVDNSIRLGLVETTSKSFPDSTIASYNYYVININGTLPVASPTFSNHLSDGSTETNFDDATVSANNFIHLHWINDHSDLYIYYSATRTGAKKLLNSWVGMDAGTYCFVWGDGVLSVSNFQIETFPHTAQDFVYNKGMFEAYMDIGITAPTTTLTTANTSYKVSYGTSNITTTHQKGLSWTEGNRLLYMGARERIFHAGLTMSFHLDKKQTVHMFWTSSNTTTYAGGQTEGSITFPAGTIPASIVSTTYDTNTAGNDITQAMHFFPQMTEGDYLTLYIVSDTASSTLTLKHINIFCLGLPNEA